jgi:AcrR family transcriptional regulator
LTSKYTQQAAIGRLPRKESEEGGSMDERRVQPRKRTAGRPDDTRQRILTIAGELFARKGYSGTTTAEIAHLLGTTQAALYYHFKSKADILDALLAEPFAILIRLTEPATLHQLATEELLESCIEFVVSAHELIPLVTGDPVVRSILDDRLPRKPQEMIDAIISALAGPRPSRAAIVRAYAAIAVIKGGILTVLATSDQHLSSSDRDEIVSAALRVLKVQASDTL